MSYRNNHEGAEMRDRIGAVVISLAVLLAGSGAAALSQDEFKLKPGARGKLCLDCHVTFQETMSLPSVHSPVKAGRHRQARAAARACILTWTGARERTDVDMP